MLISNDKNVKISLQNAFITVFKSLIKNQKNILRKHSYLYKFKDEDTNEFKQIIVTDILKPKLLSHRTKVLRANISQYDREFSEESRGNQCAAITMVALAFAETEAVHNWTPKTLDMLIRIGNDVYLNSDNGTGKKSIYLSLDEVKQDIIINDLNYHIELLHKIELHVNNDLSFVSLVDGFENFFSFLSKGAFVGNLYSFAFFSEVENDNISYYLFDSHKRDEHGLNYKIARKAALISFDNIEDMAELIVRNLNGLKKKTDVNDFKHTFTTDHEGFAGQFILFPVNISVQPVERIEAEHKKNSHHQS